MRYVLPPYRRHSLSAGETAGKAGTAWVLFPSSLIETQPEQPPRGTVTLCEPFQIGTACLSLDLSRQLTVPRNLTQAAPKERNLHEGPSGKSVVASRVHICVGCMFSVGYMFAGGGV